MQKQGRNDLCACGSGKKFKRCHGVTSDSDRSGRLLMLAVGGAVVAAVAAGVASFSTDRSASRCGSGTRPTATTTTPTARRYRRLTKRRLVGYRLAAR